MNDKNGRTGSVNCLKMHSIRKAETVHETDSTNAELKRRAANGVLKDGTVLIAERQTRGRGRRGRDDRKGRNSRGAGQIQQAPKETQATKGRNKGR